MGRTIERDLFQSPLNEVESFIKNQKDHDMQLSNFATLPAIQGSQFNHTIYSSMIKFKDLQKFLEVFHSVQRNISRRKVRSIKNYVVSGVMNREEMRFFSAVTVTCRGSLFYSHDTYKLAVATKESKLSVNDGQHRFYGISEALRVLEGKANKSKDPEEKEHIEKAIKELGEMSISLVMWDNLTEREEKQLFEDLNNLASRPSRSTTIKLSQKDPLASIARQVSKENRYLKHYGVEVDKMSIHDNNPNTILLTTVYSMVSRILGQQETSKLYRVRISEDNMDQIIGRVMSDLDLIFSALPHDMNKKNKYILDKSYTLKGVARFFFEAKYIKGHSNETVFELLRSIDYTNNIDTWGDKGASLSPRGKLQFSDYAGRTAVYTELMKRLDSLQGNLFTE